MDECQPTSPHIPVALIITYHTFFSDCDYNNQVLHEFILYPWIASQSLQRQISDVFE
jgi:hypothetical protein